MPHTRNAKKSLRKSQKRRVSNRAAKKAIKLQIKNLLGVAAQGSAEDLRKEYTLAARKLDKAAARRVIHPNMAARKKSQLAKILHKKTSGGQATTAAS
jgi:small subunit ribosomal protein S20